MTSCVKYLFHKSLFLLLKITQIYSINSFETIIELKKIKNETSLRIIV